MYSHVCPCANNGVPMPTYILGINYSLKFQIIHFCIRGAAMYEGCSYNP